MVTIKQIAQRAGVSTATVSNVIHGKTRKVSPETVARVQQLIEEMGYVQRMGLRVLRNDSSQLVAVIIHPYRVLENSVLSDPFYGHSIGVIEEELHKRDYYMMFYSSPKIEEIFKMVMTWDVDGVITVSFPRSDCEKIYNLIKKPVVSIDAHGKIPANAAVPNVGLDDAAGGYMMTRHLLECGYENIYVCGFSDMGVDHERWNGAQRAVQSSTSESRNARLQFIALGLTQEDREESYRQMIRQLPFRRRTALFFTADLLALEANSFFMENGVQVPEAFGISGFDDTLGASKLCVPRLTTIHQDIAQKGRTAVEMLVKMLQDAQERPSDVSLPVSLVVRRSTDKK